MTVMSMHDRAILVVTDVEARAISGEDVTPYTIVDTIMRNSTSGKDASDLVVELREVLLERGYDVPPLEELVPFEPPSPSSRKLPVKARLRRLFGREED